MSITSVLLPQINSNDIECYIDRITVASGEFIQKGQTLFLMQTSKAAIDVEAEISGFFVPAVQVPCKMKIGETLGWLCDTVEEVNATKTNAVKSKVSQHSTVPSAGLSTLKQAEIKNLTPPSEAVHSSVTIRLEGEALLKKAEKENWSVRTLLPLILVELEKLLLKFPLFTSHFEDKSFVTAKDPKLGLSVDIGNGLRVYALKPTASMSLEEVQNEILEIVLKEKLKKWTANDFQAVNFIVTDLSGQDILQFLPVLSKNQAACLAVGSDKALPGQPYHFTLAFDHRVLSERDAALFLSELKKNLLHHSSAD